MKISIAGTGKIAEEVLRMLHKDFSLMQELKPEICSFSLAGSGRLKKVLADTIL